MIIKSLAHIVGFFGGAIVGILAMWPMTLLALFLMAVASRSGKSSGGVVFPAIFLISGLIAILMVFVSSLIVGLFKTEPSWALVLVYGIALWMARYYRWPKPGMNFAFNGGVVCGLIVGGILFLTF